MIKRAFILSAVVVAAVALIQLGAAGRFAVYAPLLLFGPGYLLERWLRPAAPALARPGLWLALSLSLTPLVYLWATQFDLAITPFRLFLGLLVLAAALLWVLFKDREPAAAASGSALQQPGSFHYEPLLLLLVMALTAWTRVRHIDGLALPPWVDSIHHALMIRAAAEQGQAPLSLEPYLPVDQLAYHWGYHVVAAALLRASGLELQTLMLWLGQLLSTLSALALASCAAALWRRPLAPVVGGMIPGLISIMPAYYLSWGRYTLLTALLILPALLVVGRELLEQPGWRSTLLLTLLLTGLSLIHFPVFLFGLAWCAVAWLVLAWRVRWRALAGFVAAGLITLVLTLPWALVLIARVQPSDTRTTVGLTRTGDYSMPPELLWASNNRLLLALAGLGALLALWRRWPLAAAILLWSLLVLLLANPAWLGLPYLFFISNLIVVVSLFIPTSLLIGGGAAALWQVLARRSGHQSLQRWALLTSAGLLALACWSALRFQSVVRPDTILATQADLQALRWVASHTPPDARFVINTEGWMDRLNRGADGGWWLLPLAGRAVSTPPVVFIFGPPRYAEDMLQQSAWLRDAQGKIPAELAQFMREHGYTHAYATPQGRVFNTVQLKGSSLFELLYENESAAIFRLRTPPGGAGGTQQSCGIIVRHPACQTAVVRLR